MRETCSGRHGRRPGMVLLAGLPYGETEIQREGQHYGNVLQETL